MNELVIQAISYCALLGFIGLLGLGAAYACDKLFKTGLLAVVSTYTNRQPYMLTFFLSFVATLASLFLSEIAHFQPCILCWYQRIAMYPQPLMYYLAIVRNERAITPYMIALNLAGACIALYHYALHILPKSTTLLLPCSRSYAGVPCDKGYTFFFGFMTFPFMAFVVYALIIALLLLTYYKPVSAGKRGRKR